MVYITILVYIASYITAWYNLSQLASVIKTINILCDPDTKVNMKAVRLEVDS